MDVASEGELAFALAAGVPGAQLVVHGNNKSVADIRAAVAADAGLIVVDPVEELDQLERSRPRPGAEQPILLRVTPGIHADTHAHIRTAHAASKFGFAPGASPALPAAPPPPAPRPDGLHVHLGSQLRDLDRIVEAVDVAGGFPAARRLPVLDLGGGLAIAVHRDDNAPTCAPLPRPPPRRSPSVRPPARAPARARPLRRRAGAA